MQNEVSATESLGAKGFRLENEESTSALGDFTTTWSVIPRKSRPMRLRPN